MTKSASYFSVGQCLAGRFALVKSLGQGAMGTVWVARDKHMDGEPVALKVLNQACSDDRQAITDLKREVLLARRLRHPCILAVYTFWDADGARFITMEYLAGKNLARILEERGPIPLADLMPWIGQLCGALDYAHREGVLHRDIKPSNVVVDEGGRVYLVDFGIARTARESSRIHIGQRTSGTVMFMSPEQLRGDPLDQRSDLYSLASTFYELVSGRAPLAGCDSLADIQLNEPQGIEGLKSSINSVLLKALAKEPADRYSTCGEFLLHLEAAVGRVDASAPIVARPAAAANGSEETVRIEMPDARNRSLRLGQILVEKGIMTEEQVVAAMGRQADTLAKLGGVLIEMELCTEADLAQALTVQLDVPLVDLDNTTIDEGAIALISADCVRQYRCLPLRRDGDRLELGMVDPLDLVALNAVEARTGLHVEPRLVLESQIQGALSRLY